MFQSTRNELLEELIQYLNKSPEQLDAKRIHDIVRQLKEHLKEDTKWDDFNQRFENINNSFLEKLMLKHPSLNANDIRFLSFIYLNLNNKEIANLLNISPESCN